MKPSQELQIKKMKKILEGCRKFREKWALKQQETDQGLNRIDQRLLILESSEAGV